MDNIVLNMPVLFQDIQRLLVLELLLDSTKKGSMYVCMYVNTTRPHPTKFYTSTNKQSTVIGNIASIDIICSV